MLKISIILLIYGSGLLMSCQKDSDSLISDGVLIWTGDYSVDGCGFFVSINGHEYKPKNEFVIDNNYILGNKNVIIEYQLLDRKIQTACRDLPAPIVTDGLKIISIMER